MTTSPADPRRRLPDPRPALPDFKHKKHWSPRDAAQMRSLMARQMSSPLGDLQLIFLDKTIHARRGQITSYDAQDAQKRIAVIKQELVAGWGDPDSPTILVGDDAAAMMIAAAMTTPDEPLHPQEMISSSGVVFFATAQDFSKVPLNQQLDQDGAARAKRMFDHLSVRALSWFPTGPGSNGDLPGMMITLHTDGPDAQRYAEVDFPQPPTSPLMPSAVYQYLYNLASGFGHVGGDRNQYATIQPSVRTLMAFVRAVSAIARSPQTVESKAITESDKQKKLRTRKRLPAPRDIRVLALRHSEHGGYELAAATGRKVRAHWVCGHWRNQWYPSLQEHRTIWIDGYVHGDADLGVVSGPKVYVA